MDEDIRFTKDFVASTTAVNVQYHKCDYRNTFRGLWGIASGDIGDADTITVVNLTDTKTLGVATFGDAPSAGEEATWVADTTNGNYINETDDILTFTLSIAATVGLVSIGFELDPHCRVP
ncbi:MAG: hypothetical protein DRH97_01880 [Chloroflexi bacterium]|nr:MAG: hypothetical protein DRH97_01880 [Chloroflexota bacterium]